MAEKKDRKTELFKLEIRHKIQDIEYNGQIILKDLVNNFFQCNIFNQASKNAYTVKSKNLKYWISDCDQKGAITKIKLSYVVYNKKVKIVDINNFTSTKHKDKNEGDEEKQHILIKHYDGYNKAILVFEKIIGAVTVGILEKKINKEFHNTYPHLNDYEISISPVPSPEFLEELAHMNKISLLKVTIDREKATIDEDITFSEDNVCRDEVDMIFKPFPKLSLSKSGVKNYYKKYIDNKSTGKVLRIVVEGKNENNRVRLDTEGMRLSKYISTELDNDGLIDTDKIFIKYEKLVNEVFSNYLSDIVLDLFIPESE